MYIGVRSYRLTARCDAGLHRVQLSRQTQAQSPLWPLAHSDSRGAVQRYGVLIRVQNTYHISDEFSALHWFFILRSTNASSNVAQSPLQKRC